MRLLDGELVLSPSDLTKFTRCAHATTLDLGIKIRKTIKPLAGPQRSLHTDFIADKGTEHELNYIERLAAADNEVVSIKSGDLRAAAAETIDAMTRGAKYINQAVFFDGKWTGRADLLERLDDGRYEVIDLKLARSAKPWTLLQLAAYSEHLERIQGAPPERMHLILGTNERKTFRVADYAAYYRQIKRRFEQRVILSRGDGEGSQSSHLEVLRGAPPAQDDTLPYLIDFCSLCEWNLHCWRDLERMDHLVRVANIRRDDVRRLEAADIKTLTKLGDTPQANVEEMKPHTYAALHQQARLQSEFIRTNKHKYELLAPEAERGFARLPRPSKGDVFLDLEADPYADCGITYLFGVATRDPGPGTRDVYKCWWAHDRLQEKIAFENVIDFIVARRREHPDLHIYHYTAAEPSAFKRLAGEYGTREDEIDDFLRGLVFVDLFTVVRQAMRISQPSYSLKKVEAFYFKREEEGVFDAGGPILAYEEWLETRDPAMLTSIENYNREDCVSTLDLQKWLLEIRGMDPPWMELRTEEEKHDPPDPLAEALCGTGTPAGALLADLLQYHRREDRPAWWWYFDRRKMSPEELIDDHESIGGLTLAEDIPPRQEKKSTIYTFRFPPQEHKLSPGEDIVNPATEKKVNVISIDDASGLIEIKRGTNRTDAFPQSLIPGGPIQTTAQREAIRRLATWYVQPCHPERSEGPGRQGGAKEKRYKAAFDILERKPIEGAEYLFIQGPPGSGKTYWAAKEIVRLLKEGKRIGVTSNSHKAIHNLLDEVERVAKEQHFEFVGVKKCTAERPETEYHGDFIDSCADADDFLSVGPALAGRPAEAGPHTSASLIAGTSWLFADPRFDQLLDYLFIDEAGQIALANALALATSAKQVRLLGDPLQLAQVSQAVHPNHSGDSVLEHLLGEHATIPPDRGLFLEHTRRMHPDVCRFVSEVVYEGRLQSMVTGSPPIPTGLRFIAVDHDGNSQSSIQEATRVADEIAKLSVGAGFSRPSMLVVAPYNAQVRCVTEVLAQRGITNVPVGTVDKFQGREADVVFFTMATSSGADLPRDIDFLFSKNRLNVAISRARYLAIVVASPCLLDVACNTPEQMTLVNALCRFVEMAERLC